MRQPLVGDSRSLQRKGFEAVQPRNVNESSICDLRVGQVQMLDRRQLGQICKDTVSRLASCKIYGTYGPTRTVFVEAHFATQLLNSGNGLRLLWIWLRCPA